jgi:hypothetical protein
VEEKVGAYVTINKENALAKAAETGEDRLPEYRSP